MLFVGKCYRWKQGYCFLKPIDYYCWRKEILWPVGCSSGENSQGKTPYRNCFQSKNLIKRWDNGNTWNFWSAGHSAFSSLSWMSSNAPKKQTHSNTSPSSQGQQIRLQTPFIVGKNICQRSGSLQHTALLQRCCEETQQRPQQDSAVEGAIAFVRELLKYVYNKP